MKRVALAALTITLLTPNIAEADAGYHPPPDARCPQWHDEAIDAGWPIGDLARLDQIMWRESRCQPDAINPRDPNGGSRGLVQINAFWCRKNRYEPNAAGFLGALQVLEHCDELLDPAVNLEAARWIFAYQVFGGRCGWQPWTTRNTRWC